MGNITWFQNLAGATFLSPTGQVLHISDLTETTNQKIREADISLSCKPWDQEADGYCKGEAAAVVFLKKMSDTVADQILRCTSSTAVYQNENCTPVFVPNSPSLTYLFKDVLERAKLEPKNISVVEAHGTGTPVGDPAEYQVCANIWKIKMTRHWQDMQSVLQALRGSLRDSPLSLGSVNGLVGHRGSLRCCVSD